MFSSDVALSSVFPKRKYKLLALRDCQFQLGWPGRAPFRPSAQLRCWSATPLNRKATRTASCRFGCTIRGGTSTSSRRTPDNSCVGEGYVNPLSAFTKFRHLVDHGFISLWRDSKSGNRDSCTRAEYESSAGREVPEWCSDDPNRSGNGRLVSRGK